MCEFLDKMWIFAPVCDNNIKKLQFSPSLLVLRVLETHVLLLPNQLLARESQEQKNRILCNLCYTTFIALETFAFVQISLSKVCRYIYYCHGSVLSFDSLYLFS